MKHISPRLRTVDAPAEIPARAETGIGQGKIFPAVAPGQVYCGWHGVQLAVWHDTLAACESEVSWYARRYGAPGIEIDPDENPDRCRHDERVELAIDDGEADWSCVHCIECEAEPPVLEGVLAAQRARFPAAVPMARTGDQR